MRRIVSRLTVAAGIIGFFGSQRSAGAFCNDHNPYCDGGGHQGVTEVLGFLNDEVYDDIEDELKDQDSGDAEGCDAVHFDSCRFREGTDYIWGKYVQLVSKLDPANPDVFSATDDFGKLLHPVQDFYSHSNWISLLGLHDGSPVDASVLIDATVGDWPQLHPLSWIRDDIIVGQLPKLACGPADQGPYGACMCGMPTLPLPAGWSVSHPLDTDVPTVTTDGDQQFRALITGWNEDGACVDGRPDGLICDDHGCPRTAKLTHGTGKVQCDNGWCGNGGTVRACGPDHPSSVCLNRDESWRPGFEIAKTLASVQTGHEWCRLLHLASQSPFGFDAASILMSLWAKPADSDNPFGAHPIGTACAPRPETLQGAPSGPIELRVRAAMTNAPDGALPNLAFALYTSDFTLSKHSISQLSVTELEPITLCVQPTDTVLATVWGWNDHSITDDLGEIDQGDQIFLGVTEALPGPTFTDGMTTVSSPDMTVRFLVDTQVTDIDGDGLSSCGEAYYGTNHDKSDTDEDGLTDGDEVNVHHTDPLNPDSDFDGLADGTEVHAFGTNPLAADSDGDGFVDGLEIYQVGTDPLDPDTDGDQLDDLIEVNVIGTSPVDGDSDDDGLGDGSEWLTFGTDPLDADSDADGLPDGLEAKNGAVSPLDSDSDGDGLGDGSDVEHIVAVVEAMADGAFTGPGRPAILQSLDQIEALAWSGERASAALKTQQLGGRLNGCGVLPDGNDWIVSCSDQLEIRPLLVLLIAELSS